MSDSLPPAAATIRSLGARQLEEFVHEFAAQFGEEDALAILDNRHCTTQICQIIAQNARLSSFSSVRTRLVSHRASPQAQALKFIHHLYWTDLLRLSTDVRIAAVVRKAIDTQLLVRLHTMSLGEKISCAKGCSRELIKTLMLEPDPKVFAGMLVNSRLVEEDLVVLINSGKATTEQFVMIAGSRKWSIRYPIRRALVMNPATPRSIAASQLRHLTRDDLNLLWKKPTTSVYLKRCIERMDEGMGRQVRSSRG